MRKKGGDYLHTNLSAVTTALGEKATETAGQIIDVVLAALVILGVFYGVRLLIRAFKTVK